MDTVKAFNAELYSLYESKPPISKAKMTAITKGAIKAVKFYKHVVQSVEKFLQKCRVEYKIPGLYVIDSIVRQSRHQFGADKDVFAARFSKNINITFFFIYQCSNEEKSKVIRVLNLWQKNSIFQPDVIQPLFDMADSSHPKYKEVEQLVTSKGAQGPSSSKAVMSSEKETNSAAAGTGRDPTSFSAFDDSSNDNSKGQLLMGNLPPVNSSEMSLATRLQHLQHLFNPEAAPPAAPAAPPPKPPTNPSDTGQIRFNKNLLDFDYGEEDDEPAAAASRDIQQLQQKPNDSLGNLLTNPEILRHLQSLQQQITQPAINMNLLGSAAAAAAAMAGLPQGLTAAAAAANEKLQQQQGFGTVDLSQPPPGFPLLSMGLPVNLPHLPLGPHMQPGFGDLAFGAQGPQQVPFQQLADRREEAVNPFQSNNNDTSVVNDGENNRSRDKERRRSSRSRSRSASRGRSQRNRHRKGSRSRSRSRDRDRRRRSRSRSPHGGRSQRRRSRSKEREKERLEREKERERKRKGLPNLKKEHLSVCSTTLWVGHLSKLVQQEELSDTFGQYGDIVSIDLIPPRGCAFVCMHRRQDAYRALNKLAGHKLQGKAITLAWAPGKGVKSKEWKDYWELEQGVCYIPWGKISSATDMETLEEGGSIDEESLPPWLQKNGNFQDGQPGFIPMPEGPPLVGPGPPTPETASLPADSMVSTPAAGNPPGPPLTGATTLPPNLPTYGMGNIHSSLGLMPGGGLVPGVPLGLAPGLQLPPPPGLPGLLVPPNPQMQNLINQQILAGVGPIPLQQLMNQNVNLPGEPPGGGFPFRPAPPAPPHNNNDDDMELEDADEHNMARDDEIAARERAWENDDDDDQSNHLPPSQDPKANLPSLLERLRSLAHSDNVVPSPQRIAFNPDERNANPERGMDGVPPLMPRPPMEGPPHFAVSPNLASNLRGAPLTASGELGMRLIRPGGMGPNEPFGPPPMMGNHPGSPFGPPPGGFTPIRGPPAGPGPATPRMGHPGPGPGPRGLMMFDARGPRNFGPGLQGPDFGGEADRRPPQQQPWGEPWWREREEDRFRDVPEWERDRVHPGPPDRGQWGRDDRGGGPMDSRRGRDWNRKPMRNEHDRGSAGRDRFARDRDRNPRRPPPPPPPRNGERSDRDRDRRSAGRGSGRWGPPTPGGPRPSDPRELPNRVNDAATNHSEDINTDQPQPPSPQGDSSLSRPPEEERTLAVPGEEEESVDAAKSPRPAAGDDSEMADVNSNSDIITHESG